MHISDTPLLVKTHDFNVWLLNHTKRFPKHFRHTLTERLERLALDFEQSLTLANAVRGHFCIWPLSQQSGGAAT
jgi:hypothetical protein